MILLELGVRSSSEHRPFVTQGKQECLCHGNESQKSRRDVGVTEWQRSRQQLRSLFGLNAFRSRKAFVLEPGGFFLFEGVVGGAD
jgi:hypothetical protein